MHPCPSCGSPLTRAVTEGIEHWACGSCGGRLYSLGRLSKAFPGVFGERVRTVVDGGGWRGLRRCSLCTMHMVQTKVEHRSRTWFLDACDLCRVVWFDRGEHETAGGIGVPPPPDPIVDGRPSSRIYVRARNLDPVVEMEEGPYDGMTLLAALLGAPYPGREPLLYRPWTTSILAVAIAVASLFAFARGAEDFVPEWGLVPSHPFRHGGLDFITSFFLHANPTHLIGNLVVLVAFGVRAEEVLRPARYLLLVALASLFGDLLFVVFAHGSKVPSVGASGGISGVLVYWALAFPHSNVRLATLTRYGLLRFRLTARFALASWIVLQVGLAMAQVEGWGSVNALAHLGGGAIGLVFWMLWPD